MNKHEDITKEYSLRKVIKGASIYSFGDVILKASGFFLIPIYTRLLTPKDYGIVGYLQVFNSILVVFFGFGFHGAQTRYFFEHQDDKEATGSFMFTINITTFVAFLIVCVPLMFLGFFRKWTIGSENIAFHPYLSITLVSVLFTVLNEYVATAFRMRQKFLVAALINIFTFFLTTASTIWFVVSFRWGALGQIAGKTFSNVIVFLVFYFLYTKQFFYKFSISKLRYAVIFGFPVVIHLLMGTIHSSIDRIILEYYLPISDLGIYTLGASVSGVLQMFIIAFNQAYQPSYYQLMQSGNGTIEKHIVSTFKIWLAFVTLATCIGIIVGGPFLTIFAGPQFKDVGRIFPFLLLSVYAGSFYYFFSSPIFFFKKTHVLPYITGSSVVINIGLNLLLIPKYGIYGATVATIFSHIWITLSSYWYGNRLFMVRWPILQIICSVSVVSIVFGITVMC